MRKPRSQRPMKAGRCGETTTIQPEAYLLSQWLNFRTNRQANRKQLLSLLFFNYCRYAPNRLESCAVETLFGRRDRRLGAWSASPLNPNSPNRVESRGDYSTVTDLARLRGWSTSHPRRTAMWYASSCSGTTSRIGSSSSGACG